MTDSTVSMARQGWTYLYNAAKWHYFVEARSLCGKWGYFGPTEDLEPDNGPSKKDCAGCRKVLTKLAARVKTDGERP